MNITGVLLNWKRPANVGRILDAWRQGGLVTEAIVWNNNPDSPFSLHPWAKVINAAQDLGLYTRFLTANLAENDCVLIQDDDLILPDESLRRLHDAWREQPDILHGIFGREPKPDGSYAKDVTGDREAPIVLTRALLSHRRYFAEFFRALPAFEHLQRNSRPFGNGEDIIFSYVVRALSQRLNRVYGVSVKELPAPHAIHARPGHREHRTTLLRECEAWLAGHCEHCRAYCRPALEHTPWCPTRLGFYGGDPAWGVGQPGEQRRTADGRLFEYRSPTWMPAFEASDQDKSQPVVVSRPNAVIEAKEIELPPAIAGAIRDALSGGVA